MPLFMVRQFPAEEILYQRMYDNIEAKELEDARLIAKGRPPKHYPTPQATAEQEARAAFAEWSNAFEL